MRGTAPRPRAADYGRGRAPLLRRRADLAPARGPARCAPDASPGAAALLSFAAAAGAMAWGAAHGWDAASFRVYYLAGALLSAPLLGIGSLQLWRRRLGRAARPALHGPRRRRRRGDGRPRELRGRPSHGRRITSTSCRAWSRSSATPSARWPWSSSRSRRCGAGRARMRSSWELSWRLRRPPRSRRPPSLPPRPASRWPRCCSPPACAPLRASSIWRLERVPRDHSVGEELVGRLALAALERLRPHVAEVARDLLRPFALPQHAPDPLEIRVVDVSLRCVVVDPDGIPVLDRHHPERRHADARPPALPAQVTRGHRLSVTQTAPAPAAMPRGRPSTWMGASASSVAGSMRTTVLSPHATQTAPSPKATASAFCRHGRCP